jgi:hypothetical protein
LCVGSETKLFPTAFFNLTPGDLLASFGGESLKNGLPVRTLNDVIPFALFQAYLDELGDMVLDLRRLLDLLEE